MKLSTFLTLSILLPVIFIGAFFMLSSGYKRKESRGIVVYNDLGCGNCHGADLAGTQQGPSLKSIKSRWRKNTLITFMKNPNHRTKKHQHVVKAEQNAKRLRIHTDKLTWKQTIALTDYLLKVE